MSYLDAVRLDGNEAVPTVSYTAFSPLPLQQGKQQLRESTYVCSVVMIAECVSSMLFRKGSLESERRQDRGAARQEEMDGGTSALKFFWCWCAALLAGLCGTLS